MRIYVYFPLVYTNTTTLVAFILYYNVLWLPVYILVQNFIEQMQHGIYHINFVSL